MYQKEFSKWLREYKQTTEPFWSKIVEKKGGLVPENLDSYLLQQYLNYRIIEVNKSLVKATWILVIFTILLNIINIIILLWK